MSTVSRHPRVNSHWVPGYHNLHSIGRSSQPVGFPGSVTGVELGPAAGSPVGVGGAGPASVRVSRGPARGARRSGQGSAAAIRRYPRPTLDDRASRSSAEDRQLHITGRTRRCALRGNRSHHSLWGTGAWGSARPSRTTRSTSSTRSLLERRTEHPDGAGGALRACGEPGKRMVAIADHGRAVVRVSYERRLRPPCCRTRRRRRPRSRSPTHRDRARSRRRHRGRPTIGLMHSDHRHPAATSSAPPSPNQGRRLLPPCLEFHWRTRKPASPSGAQSSTDGASEASHC